MELGIEDRNIHRIDMSMTCVGLPETNYPLVRTIEYGLKGVSVICGICSSVLGIAWAWTSLNEKKRAVVEADNYTFNQVALATAVLTTATAVTYVLSKGATKLREYLDGR